MLIKSLWLFSGVLAMAGIVVPAPHAPRNVKGENRHVETPHHDRRGRAFLALSDFADFSSEAGKEAHEVTLTSPELPLDVPANEIVVSWNADAPEGTGLTIEARARYADHVTKFYTLGLWSKDAGRYPRQSVKAQKDADGDVATDTLELKSPPTKLQLRVTLRPDEKGTLPTLKFLGVSLTDIHAHSSALEPNRDVWGKEVVVPGRPQTGYPDASGWCSPTSTTMVLAFWAKKLDRSELELPVPDVAHACFDKVYDGTGNWPFNTAFAGSFPGLRAYVTRLSDIRELEDWIALGIPPIVSVSYDLLKGKEKDNDPGHLMVCDGFDKNGDIVLNDPAHHPERGEVARRVFPRANFLKGWARSKNTVYLIYPVGAKLPADVYGHWEAPHASGK